MVRLPDHPIYELSSPPAPTSDTVADPDIAPAATLEETLPPSSLDAETDVIITAEVEADVVVDLSDEFDSELEPITQVLQSADQEASQPDAVDAVITQTKKTGRKLSFLLFLLLLVFSAIAVLIHLKNRSMPVETKGSILMRAEPQVPLAPAPESPITPESPIAPDPEPTPLEAMFKLEPPEEEITPEVLELLPTEIMEEETSPEPEPEPPVVLEPPSKPEPPAHPELEDGLVEAIPADSLAETSAEESPPPPPPTPTPAAVRIERPSDSNIIPDATNEPATTPLVAPVGEVIHTVGPGDSLSRLANKYQVTVAAIKQENQIRNDVIVVGQKIRIPHTSTPANP